MDKCILLYMYITNYSCSLERKKIHSSLWFSFKTKRKEKLIYMDNRFLGFSYNQTCIVQNCIHPVILCMNRSIKVVSSSEFVMRSEKTLHMVHILTIEFLLIIQSLKSNLSGTFYFFLLRYPHPKLLLPEDYKK